MVQYHICTVLCSLCQVRRSSNEVPASTGLGKAAGYSPYPLGLSSELMRAFRVFSPSRDGISECLRAKGSFTAFPREKAQVAFRLSFHSQAPEGSSALG